MKFFFCNLLKWPLNLQSELIQCKMLTFMVLLGTLLSREKRALLSYLCFLCDLASVCRVTVGQSGLAGALVTGESRESQLSVFSARDNKSL